ncbi:Toxin [bacterium HR41]|nr:Toxin [bacterium HR41]
MRVETSIDLPAEPERCFALVTDPERLGEWVTIHERIVEAPRLPLAKGAEMVQVLRLAGRGVEVRWRVEKLDPPRLIEWLGRGPLGSRARALYRLEPLGNGRTRFEYLNEFDLPGGPLGKVAARSVAPLARRETDASLERLRALIERES